MKRLIVFALIFTLVGETAVAFAAGPLEESARRAAQGLAQVQGQSSNKARLLWTGAALAGAGVALVALSFTALHKSECTNILSRGVVVGKECLDADNVAVGLAGLVLMGVGGTVTVIGVLKEIDIRPNSVAYRVRF